ncbi:MAG TPA: serine protease [Thermoanaerobaculia bacterium]|nr:serine protease [Thermoanaerobaculia bacterium]
MERTKYGFPVARVVCAVAAFVLAASAKGDEPGETAAINLRQNTVRIETRIGSETENGFGFIVGEDEGTLYAVTAYHVVASEDVDAEPPVVKVELFKPQGKLIDAEVLGKHDSEHDLAVITFRAPKGFQWNKNCFGSEEEQNRSTKVWFVGRQGEWTVPTSPGTISSEEPDDGEIEIERLDVLEGSSGGPLIAASGIVGMVVTDSAVTARALSIRFIKRRLDKWQHPFDLEKSAPAPKAADARREDTSPEDAPPEDPVLAKGAAIAARDPYFAALRELQREGPARRGFDRGMASAENQTAWGPGKQAMLEKLSGDEQEGFRIATWFAVDRNKNNELAAKGEAIAEADPLVAAARTRSSDPRYWLGFDIATAIFGNPRLGAQGNTATGTGSLGLRDSLKSPEAQRGFNASVAHHLSRKY